MIKKLSEEIRGKMEGGTLFGKAIDFTDNDQLLVAAYNMGKSEEVREKLRQSEFIRSLRR